MLKKLLLICLLGLSSNLAVANDVVWQEQKINLQNTPPQHLAVYDLGALDILNSLGVQAEMVAKLPKFPATLDYYNQNPFTDAGSLFEPKYDVLKANHADLIFVGGRTASKQAELNQIAPTLNFSAQTENYSEDLKKRSEWLAKLFNKENELNQWYAKIDESREILKKQTKGKTAAMLFVVAKENLFVPQAENESYGYIYKYFGSLKSVVPLAKMEKNGGKPPVATNGKTLTAAEQKQMDAFLKKRETQNLQRLKAIVKANPDYVIVLDRGALFQDSSDAVQAIKKHPVLSKLKGKIIVVNTEAWYLVGSGLANTKFMIDELIEGTK